MSVIQPLSIDHLSALIALESRCFVNQWSHAQLKQHLTHERTISLGVFTPNFVGFILISVLLDEAELLQIAVAPECRGEGVGKQLLAAGVSVLQGQHIQRLMLEVRESNAAARALYQNFNFVEDGRRRGYYPPLGPSTDREDALLFSLML